MNDSDRIERLKAAHHEHCLAAQHFMRAQELVNEIAPPLGYDPSVEHLSRHNSYAELASPTMALARAELAHAASKLESKNLAPVTMAAMPPGEFQAMREMTEEERRERNRAEYARARPAR